MTAASHHDVFAVHERISVPVLPPPRRALADLPADGPLQLGGVHLGCGRRVVARHTPEEPDSPDAALWLADAGTTEVASTWRRLADLYEETGLWPLVLTSLGYDADQRPWGTGDLMPVPTRHVDRLSAAEVLDRGWRESVIPMGADPFVEHVRPYGARFPGLAEAPPRRDQPTLAPADAVAGWGLPQLGLVPCRRPADAVALVGWTGAINTWTAAEVCAVLRSWEDRFGVVLCGLGFATMTLLVPHPPADPAQALPIAAEMTAFCRDVLGQDGPVDGFGYLSGGTVPGLARLLVDRPVWKLWWD